MNTEGRRTPEQIVFLDIDGCLTPGKNKPVHRAHIWLMQEAMESASEYYGFVIVTARPAPYAEAVLQFLGLMDVVKHCPAVCESGAVLHRFGSNTYAEAEGVDQAVLSACRQELLKLAEPLGFSIEDGRLRTICLIPPEGQASHELGETICSYIPAELEMHISAGGVDIVPCGIDKGVAVRELAIGAEIDLARSVAVGDSESDAPMIRLVGFPACPANASDGLKEIVRRKSGYIARQGHCLGVAEILRHYARSVAEMGRE